jgi:hydroxymethylbilane synthase
VSVPSRVTIATRESALALWQAHHIRTRLLTLYPGLEVEILGITTQGDRLLSSTLTKVGGKGLFVKDLESALEEGRAQIAVHSMKDVPVLLPPGFTIAAVGEREDPRDAFVSNQYAHLSSLVAGARVGTSSLRRESQLRAHYPHVVVAPLRGNVHTRLRKLDEGHYTAVILAAAGLKRLGLASRITVVLEPEESLPAAGQGALAIECRESRVDLIEMLAPLCDPETQWCVRAERSVSRGLSGSCVMPIAAFARRVASGMSLRGFVASPDGTKHVSAEEYASDLSADPEALGEALAHRLLAAGAREILAALTHEQ